MHLSRQVFIWFLVLNSNKFQIFQDSFVSALSVTPFDAGNSIISNAFDWVGKNPIDDFVKVAKSIVTESFRLKSSIPQEESSWLTKSIRTAITVTTKFCKYPKPLTFFTPLDETCLVNRTIDSLQISLTNSITVSTVTGGVFGHGLFEFHGYSFAWNIHLCNSSYIFEAHVYYKNTNYATFAEALKHSDGVVVVVIPIETGGDFGNPQFDQYGLFLNTKLKGPGHSATIRSGLTYIWFVTFPFDGIYTTYKTKYTDPSSGQTGIATAMELPYDPQKNYISRNQFNAVFAKMWDKSGQMSQDFKKLSPEERRKGLHVFNLPA